MGLRQLFVTTDSTTNIISLNYNTSNVDGAQIYTCTEDGYLGAVRPYMTRVGSPSGVCYVEVYSGGTLGAGTLLGTSNTIDLASIFVNTSASYPQFNFSTNVAQVNGQQYWLRFISTSPLSTSNGDIN